MNSAMRNNRMMAKKFDDPDFQFPPNLIKVLQDARKIAILTGAGVSAESGIPTFRDDLTGLWKEFNAEELASERGFMKDPPLVWGWYEWRRNKVLQAEPNGAHLTIALMQTTLPKVTVITQNVDGLHERTGTQCLRLHGSLHEPQCIHCDAPYKMTEEEISYSTEVESRVNPPKCLQCGCDVRPGIVWFGESLDTDIWEDSVEACNEADLVIIVGTSGQVYPAASLPYNASTKGAKILEINKDPGDFRWTDWTILGKAGEVLPALYEAAFGIKNTNS